MVELKPSESQEEGWDDYMEPSEEEKGYANYMDEFEPDEDAINKKVRALNLMSLGELCNLRYR